MLAIIFTLKEWRQYLLDAHEPFTILTDYKNLEYFTKPQDLSRRQARWNQIRQEYHYVIQHRPSKTNPADLLSQRPDFEKGVKDNTQITLFPMPSVRSAERSIQKENSSQDNALAAVHPSDPESSVRSAVRSVQNNKLPQDNALAAVHLSDPDSIKTLITKNQYQAESFIKKGLEDSQSPWYTKDNLIYWKTLLYIPPNPTLRERVIKGNHDHPLAGHSGIHQTLDLVKTRYYWPTIKQDIHRYIKGCDKCQHTKTDNQGKKTPLNPNEVPNSPWEIISVDLISPLPKSHGKNAIMVIVDQFSKMI